MKYIAFANQSRNIVHFSLLLILVISSVGSVPSVQAQGPAPTGPVDSATPEQTTETPPAPPADVSTATPLPTVNTMSSELLTPTVQLTPTAEMLSAMDVSAAGTGTLFRAQIRLKSPYDIKRLQSWQIEVLQSSTASAYVQVDEAGLAKLARLGFEPTNIDSLDYMVTVYNSLRTEGIVAPEELASDPNMLMTLSTVDTDADGLTDTEEAWWCTDPQDSNSDFVGDPTQGDPNDGDEVQAILNGEISYGPPFEMWPDFRPYRADGTCQDGDFDGVPDNAELYMIGTSPQRESSDKDKFDDGQELFGVTFCPALSGPCGYGILPRAEDAAFVTTNLPAWVKAPGNSPFVAAFPEPQVEVEPSSIAMTQKTVITNTKGTSVGTEKTYGTSTTTGTSTSVTDTTTWNTFEEISVTKALDQNRANPLMASFAAKNPLKLGKTSIIRTASDTVSTASPLFEAANLVGKGIGYTANWLIYQGSLVANGQPLDLDFSRDDYDPNGLQEEYCNYKYGASCDLVDAYHLPPLDSMGDLNSMDEANQNLACGQPSHSIVRDSNNSSWVRYAVPMTYPAPFTPTQTSTSGKEWGGSHSTSNTEYEEQTISESSTNQYSDNWSTATAVDSTHSADLRFTYGIVNNGTEYAREVTSLTFNIYIGSNPNPAYTYVAVGSTGQIDKIENLFPDESLTYTSAPIALTLDEMRAIDEGAPIRIVMADIAFGQDQVFYQDAFNGSVLVAMEDGFDDGDEVIDSYLIPVWDPNDTVQDVVKRYFPVTEDVDGNLLSISTPEFDSNPPAFDEHSLTGTSWWNIYLSEGLDYVDAFKDTIAQPNSSVLIRIVTDSDLDGYNNRNEIRLGTDPNDPTLHPSPNLLAGYTKSCTGSDCTVRMAFQNLGNYDAYGVEAIMYTPDGLVNITNNTIGGSGRVSAGEKVIVSDNDTFQYTITGGSPKDTVIVVSYNDPQGNHRFILPAGALLATLDDDLTPLNGKMLPDPGVDIASTSAADANFVIFSPHAETITNGKLFVEYIDSQGNVAHEDVFTQDFASGPTVIPVTVDTVTYPPENTILLAFFTDSQGNIIDSSARPLASFGADPLPEVNLTISGDWQVGTRAVPGIVDVLTSWDFGAVEPGTTLYADITLGNTGLGDLRYSLTGWGNGVTVTGIASGSLGASNTRLFSIAVDTAGLPNGSFNKTLTLRTNDPIHASVSINLTGTISTPAGTATAYKVNNFHPWDQYVYVPGPHSQNDVVTFTHTLVDDPSRMFPLYLYTEDGSTLKGVGEYGVDFSGQTTPFGVFGTGADGDLIVTSGQTIYTDNTRSALASTASGGQTNLTLSSSSGFSAGQEILVIQIQGTGAGNYEFGTIANIAGNTLTLSKNLTNGYAVGGTSKAQVIRVPNYQNVTVQSGGTLTVHGWNGSTGGVLSFRSSGTVLVDGVLNTAGVGFVGGQDANLNQEGTSGYTGEGFTGPSVQRNDILANSSGGGGGRQGSGNGGGGGGSHGTQGTNGVGENPGQHGDLATDNFELSKAQFGGGGGAAGGSEGQTNDLGGGNGGGVILLFSRQVSVNGYIVANGNNGRGISGLGGGGGAGGAILIKSQQASLGTNRVQATGGTGMGASYHPGGNGGVGRIRIEYNTLSGSTNPTASTQQVNFYSLTGSSTSSLYLPEAITSGLSKRYQLQYGQRSFNTDGGDQLFSVRLPNRQYSNAALSVLLERVTGSSSTVNFCLDFGNDGICDWMAGNQNFSAPVPLDSPDLKNVLNAYITAQNSSQEMLVIPIRVNISTPADILLFNLSAAPGADADLVPANLTITPPNGNPPSNIPEGSQVTLSAIITNNGTHRAGDFTVAFYNGDPETDGVLIGSTFIQSLAAGATSAPQDVIWNTTGLLGSKTIYVKVDASNKIVETNEANNTASATTVIKKKADLLITQVTVPDLRQNETGNANVTVKNEGEADVTGALIRLYLGTDATGTLIGSTTVDVPKGQTANGQISFSIPNAGEHSLFVKADPDNTVLEANESNNIASSFAQTGWSLLTVDAGGGNDSAYTSSSGYGWLMQGTVVTSCGTALEKSFRQTGSAEPLKYRFDNLLPDRSYHLDLTLATCSGERYVNVFVDGKQTFESGQNAVQTAQVTSDPHTISLLLDPADYADGSVVLSIQRASGLSGPLVNIIDLQEVRYCYRDSGPNESPWTAANGCGYDSAGASDGFNGWGTTPAETIRFDEAGEVPYKFTQLDPAKIYNLRLTFYEEDHAGRIERLLYDGSPSLSYALNASVQKITEGLPQASYADGEVDLVIERTGNGDAIVSELTLEENTRAENSRYPVPGTLTPATPTPTLDPATDPVVQLSSFSASWSGSQINLQWGTTSEINNSSFKLYRSPDALAWTEIASISSTRPCGSYAGTTPVPYTYTDLAVTSGQTYYYRLGFSGENCGSGFAAMPSMLVVEPLACYQLTTAVNPSGSGEVHASAQNCEGGYTAGTVVELRTSANTGYAFNSWSGAASGSANPMSITMDQNKSVTANFASVPVIASSVRQNSNPSNQSTVFFLVTFSKAVTGVDRADFVPVTTDGIANASIASVSGTGATRSVGVNTGTGNGTIRLDVAADATITDLAGNALQHQSFTPDEEYTMERALALPYPANGELLLHRRPTFGWASVSGAASYQIVASTVRTFSTVLWKVSTTTNTYTPSTDLPAGKVIYWRVRAKVAGVWGPWSETRSFTTPRSPSIPILVSPANKVITKDYTPQLKWKVSTIPSGGTAFDHYQVQVSTDKTFPEPLLIDAVTPSGNVNAVSFTQDTDLPPNRRYYWRVRAFNVAGQYSSWSTVWYFSTALLPPNNLVPTNGEAVLTRKLLLDWAMVEGAASYTIQISTSSSFSTLLVNATVKTDAFTPGINLPANRTLYWRVRANGTNGPSNWTTASFHTP